MNPHHTKKALLFPTVLLSFSLMSCVDPMYSGGFSSRHQGGYNSYSTLPQGYSGSAYLYNGRYYSGGQYQTGNYNYQGRQYSNRYHHNGQYYYGGSNSHYPGDGHNHGSSALQQQTNRNHSSYQGSRDSSNRYYR